jgi:sirohydrochlorin cobaltochelatase
MSRAIVLVGHGVPPRDCPRELVMRLKALEGRRRASGTPMTDEERTLDAQVRSWPRTDATDPYRAGMERLASAMRARLAENESAQLVVAYNEFCAPSLEDVVRALAGQGITRIDVVPSMLTPGGVHAEVEIPESIAALALEHPSLRITYAWPFDLDVVAALLVARVEALGS